MAMKALIVQGGWKGHEPKETADILAAALKQRGVEAEIADSLDAFADYDKLMTYDLLTPHWTMGEAPKEAWQSLVKAVENGVSLGGIHGGMGDAFRSCSQYQFMVGGQFVAHPGGGGTTYQVHIVDHEHEITKGMQDFSVTSEQYYMHVDPSLRVLAMTLGPGNVVMPVAWIRKWGKGAVYYCSLGHNAEHLSRPETLELCIRGMVWAARQTAANKAS
ncbi:MAG: Trehalose utilization [candidate division BRC1 bacterium ADurb.BinA364]|nr:MAG: Trehalose utilization [candidate division BRC1 bacterium ADurb.BinA364]